MSSFVPTPAERGVGIALLTGAGAFVLLCATILAIGARRHAPADEPRGAETSFVSGGRTIPVERFQPAKPGRYPAILFVHGADGLQVPAWHARYRRECQTIADGGYVVLLAHYMDRTGTKWAGLPDMMAHFADWMRTLGDMATWAAKQPGVEGERLGICGVSLGASLAVANAAMDPRLKAAVEFFGGFPPGVTGLIKQAKTVPPILILHGDQDWLVNVREAHRLDGLLKAKGLPHEMHIYRGQSHGFLGDSERDALERTVAFFDRHLKAKAVGGPP